MIYSIRVTWKAVPPVQSEGIKTVYADTHSKEEAEALFLKSHYAQGIVIEHYDIKPAIDQGSVNHIIHDSMISDARKQEISLPRDLLRALKEALLYIETCEAVRGKALNEADWDSAVKDFQQSSVARIGIGRCYVDKAAVELVNTRKLIKFAEEKIPNARG